MEALSDAYFARHGGTGRVAGVYTEQHLRDEWIRHHVESLEGLTEAQLVEIAPPELLEPTGSPLARLVRCLPRCGLTETENKVLRAMIQCYTGPRRPVFRMVARVAKCSPTTACASWASAARKIVHWAEEHPIKSNPRRDMIEVLRQAFGGYALRLAGLE